MPVTVWRRWCPEHPIIYSASTVPRWCRIFVTNHMMLEILRTFGIFHDVPPAGTGESERKLPGAENCGDVDGRIFWFLGFRKGHYKSCQYSGNLRHYPYFNLVESDKFCSTLMGLQGNEDPHSLSQKFLKSQPGDLVWQPFQGHAGHGVDLPPAVAAAFAAPSGATPVSSA